MRPLTRPRDLDLDDQAGERDGEYRVVGSFEPVGAALGAGGFRLNCTQPEIHALPRPRPVLQFLARAASQG